MTAQATLRRTGARAACAAGAVATVALAGAAMPALGVHRPSTLCLLRATTGVPCPLCGTTTAAVRLGGGDVPGALAANPVTVVAALALVLLPVLAPYARRVPRSAVPALLTAGAALAWAWQLARFDIV